MSTAREVDMMATDRRRVLPGAGQPGRQRIGRVLLVEDEQDVAELIRYNLTKEGYDVVMTANGADALRLARERQPDVVLLDIMVPQLNGWEVCRRLKKERRRTDESDETFGDGGRGASDRGDNRVRLQPSEGRSRVAGLQGGQRREQEPQQHRV